ncbi:hypothetical protein PCASD_10987 [Puccinia coronata f. sp. avenae]|uniref:Uncharacterized protein n=1 Tax=Puccinia coronata f. sp. avenae TaxID=200324 RepID=A0A2N5TEN8_9BASI|nr:hypothetical protein PCASD_10987 [Puccinia coronata f. sp. avenae]
MRALSRPFMKFLFLGPAKTASQLTPLPAARVLHRRVRQPPRTKIRPTRPVSNGFLCPFPITKQSTILQTQPLQRMPNQNGRRTGQADDGTSFGRRISSEEPKLADVEITMIQRPSDQMGVDHPILHENWQLAG